MVSILYLLIGSSGDVLTNLSVGLHTMVVRFTPDGHCQPLSDQLSLDLVYLCHLLLHQVRAVQSMYFCSTCTKFVFLYVRFTHMPHRKKLHMFTPYECITSRTLTAVENTQIRLLQSAATIQKCFYSRL